MLRPPIRLMAAASTVLVAACATESPVPPSPGQVSGYSSLHVTAANRMSSVHQVWIELESESHVGVFEVIQDRGAVLVWPYSPDTPRTLSAGRTNLPPRTMEEERISTWRRSYLHPESRSEFSSGREGPAARQMILVVASSQPLDLDRYLADHGALSRDLLGAANDPATATARILDLLIENPEAHNWAWACVGTLLWCRGR